MPQRKFNLFFPAVMSLLALVVSISSAQAQYCPSSQLNYIVRDASGKIINPAKLDAPDFIEEDVMEVSYAEAEKKREGRRTLGEAVKGYVLLSPNPMTNIGADGLKDLILKVERDSFEDGNKNFHEYRFAKSALERGGK